MTQNGYELLAELRAQTLDMFLVPNELLPDEYHGKIQIIGSKKRYRKLSSIDKQFEKSSVKRDGRETSVKFNNDDMDGTPERMAMIAHYRTQYEAGVEDFQPYGGLNEAKQYRAELAFIAALIQAGAMEPIDPDNGFDE